ncbi:hypothetical protein CABS03_15334 [Colletotrichum abscissum]
MPWLQVNGAHTSSVVQCDVRARGKGKMHHFVPTTTAQDAGAQFPSATKQSNGPDRLVTNMTGTLEVGFCVLKRDHGMTPPARRTVLKAKASPWWYGTCSWCAHQSFIVVNNRPSF